MNAIWNQRMHNEHIIGCTGAVPMIICRDATQQLMTNDLDVFMPINTLHIEVLFCVVSHSIQRIEMAAEWALGIPVTLGSDPHSQGSPQGTSPCSHNTSAHLPARGKMSAHSSSGQLQGPKCNQSIQQTKAD